MILLNYRKEVEKMTKRRKWTKEEDLYIIEHYLHLSYKKIGEHLNRTEPAINFRTKKLGLSKAPKEWSDSDVLYLKTNYKGQEIEDIAQTLNRTPRAISGKAQELGLSKGLYYTKEEEQYIIDNYTKMPAKEIGRKLNRDTKSIQAKAQTLGVANNMYAWSDKQKKIKGEIWRDVKGYENIYQVSNKGRVKSLPHKQSFSHGGVIQFREMFLKPRIHSNDYLRVSLSKNGEITDKYIHRLVAKVFIPNPKNKPQINHINFNKHDNCTENLEWVSSEENVHHSAKHGRLGVSLTPKDIDQIMLRLSEKNKDIAKDFNVTENVVSNIRAGKTWSAYTGIKRD